MRFAGDSILVWDPSLQRISVFSSAGDYGRSFPDASVRGTHADWPAWKMSSNSQGTVVASMRNPDDLRPVREGPIRVEMDIQLTSLLSGSSVDLGRVPGDEFYFMQGTLAPRPLGKMTLVAIGDSRVYVAAGDDFGIAVFTLTGKRLAPVGPQQPTVALNRERIDAYIDQAVKASRNGESARGFYRDLEYPERLPSYSGLLVDANDNLWAEQYAVPGDEAGTTWRVYDQDGNLKTSVQMPRGLEVFEVGSDYVLGVWQDDLGVDFVRKYELTKPDDVTASGCASGRMHPSRLHTLQQRVSGEALRFLPRLRRLEASEQVPKPRHPHRAIEALRVLPGVVPLSFPPSVGREERR